MDIQKLDGVLIKLKGKLKFITDEGAKEFPVVIEGIGEISIPINIKADKLKVDVAKDNGVGCE